MELVIPSNLLDDGLIVLKDAEVSEVTEEDLFVKQSLDQSLVHGADPVGLPLLHQWFSIA